MDNPNTEILSLFREYRALMDAAGTYPNDTDEVLERLFHRPAREILDRMMALPCTCAADFAAKVIADTCEGGLLSDWETGDLWIEARDLTGYAA
ncbi:hypothetical protein [Amaricoccus solimangrovi]|uniref:Uncharacterized protein n=1 Tax=Amaricoccus solimangrovi TaxID=2589815 RepID=A0A501WYA8_9RHOB|nr:hypothetical protein [Amaricoccus solimangrovi]TPE53214.1 hypothetical protein FJM51_04125 [Amaricoccus solimangrovi]